MSDAEFAEIVSRALGRPAAVKDWSAEVVDYPLFGSPSTGALWRIHGVTDDGEPFRIFLKVVQSPRHWPHLHLLPEHTRQRFVDDFPWRTELAAWQPAFLDHLPPGLRVPHLYRLAELGDDRVAVWMEDVQQSTDVWEVPRFARAARLLGGFAAGRSNPDLIAGADWPPGFGLRMYRHARLMGALPQLEDDALWAHPVVTASVDEHLRTDLRTLAGRIDQILDRLDQLPQALPHGDASPQNLLVPSDEPETFVAIDASFQTPHAIGFDLGQLLVGLVHAGQFPAHRLPELDEVLTSSFRDGMAERGKPSASSDIAYGFHGSLVIRSAFTALPWERLEGPSTPDLIADFSERALLTRFIVDRGLAL
ncbi:aminoglycoside phosphotransferase [Herbidospora galbida]|uniref:Aminoglycoside phosphotransferase n=1 Tax=Herbidospora galbida TaxID=2575442 RepID=A0A4U3MFT4_9ACTN|nr:aminoglycoside phosphotransferase [Herbidospora galbida]TKK88135.1 aminoglycoside phosphotransferase [Herbidospora galbida]